MCRCGGKISNGFYLCLNKHNNQIKGIFRFFILFKKKNCLRINKYPSKFTKKKRKEKIRISEIRYCLILFTKFYDIIYIMRRKAATKTT